MMPRIYIGIALLLAGALGVSWVWREGKVAGIAQCEASHANDAAKAQDEQDRRASVSSEATGSMLDYLARTMPPIETTTHEAIERVRIVYRDHPVPAVCKWDERVRDELEAARIRANATSGQVRPSPAAHNPAHP